MRLRECIEKTRSLGLDVKFDVPGSGEGGLCISCLETEITGLSFDSREVEPGTLFVCKGAGFKQEYLDAAIERGAIAWVSGPDIRRAMAVLSNLFYMDPWKSFPLVGITGTKGKTTTLYYLKEIMEHSVACGKGRFGYLSTIDTYDGESCFKSQLTTPEAIELGQRLANMREHGIKAACMEVSSQALKYDRTFGLRFKYGVFTNFGKDHIGSSEHPDIKDYLDSKLRIFDQSDVAILGRENEKFDEAFAAAQECEKIICYDAQNVRKDGKATVFDAVITAYHPEERSDEGSVQNVRVLKDLRLTMPGTFNAHNAAAAAAIALQLGASEEEIRANLLNARTPGRMEIFENKERQVAAVADYAHNGLSFEKALQSAREEFPGYRIVAIYGCTGSKGLTRRKELPEAAAKYADYSIITEDDPGYEDPMDIAREAYENLQNAGGKGEICIDREKAIREAICDAEPRTLVMILGKGADKYQLRNGRHEPYESDIVLAEKFIKEI